MIIAPDLQKQFASLSAQQRARVAAILRRHTDACRRLGAAAELPGKILKEAIELVELEDACGQPQLEDWTAATINQGLQGRRYETYRAPAEP